MSQRNTRPVLHETNACAGWIGWLRFTEKENRMPQKRQSRIILPMLATAIFAVAAVDLAAAQASGDKKQQQMEQELRQKKREQQTLKRFKKRTPTSQTGKKALEK